VRGRAARARPAFRFEADGAEGMPAPADGAPKAATAAAQVARAEPAGGRSAAPGRTATPMRTAVLACDGLAAFTGAVVADALANRGADHPRTASVGVLAGLILPGAVRILQHPLQGPGGFASLRLGLSQLLIAGIAGMWAAALAASWLSSDISAADLLLPWAGALLLLGLCRLVWSLLGRHKRERVLVVGTGTVARRFPALARRHPEQGLEVIGFVGDAEPGADAIDGLPVLGALNDVPRVVALGAVDRVIVACHGEQEAAAVLPLLRACGAGDLRVDVVPRFFDLVAPELASYTLGSVPIITVSGTRPTLAQRATKRALDVAIAGLAAVLLSPVLVAIALGIALEDGRPIFFRQRRIGRGGAPFDIIKFRTMRREPEPQVVLGEGIGPAVQALKTNQRFRLTRIGEFLRVTSLDELPQLLNVLRGEMSLVGPRPLRDFELQALEPWQQRARLEVRPGMTGLWQVSGRSLTTWEERMELDATYVRHRSLGADLRILLRTIPAVLTRRGAL
jgi:exopolysaccharide biosynthesis polyprenyl glycosylphosphotransferase